MKHCVQFFFHCILSQFLFAQKPTLSFNDCGTWPQLFGEAISSDGKYVLYQIEAKNSISRLFIQSAENSFKREIVGAKNAAFTDDANYVIFINHGDSLCILDLHTLTDLFVPDIRSYKIAQNGGQTYLAMLQSSKDLLLYNLVTGDKRKYIGVNNYIFDGIGKQLLLQKTPNTDSVHTSILELVDLQKSTRKIIWEGEKSSNYAFNKTGTSIAFVAEAKVQKGTKNSIWIYQGRQFDKATLLLDDQGLKMNDSFYIANNRLQFSPNGEKLFFSLKRNLKNDVPVLKNVAVQIWNYQDPVLVPESDNIKSEEKYRFYSAVINLNALDKKIVRFQGKGRLSRSVQLINGGNKYAVIVSVGNSMEISWNQSARSDIYIVSTNDGSIKNIKRNCSFVVNALISPGGKYVLWYDREKSAYFTYNTERGTIKNISQYIPTLICWEDYDGANYSPEYGPAVWLENDESVLLYDRYDIWRVDPEGLKPPENITQGQGRKSKVIFRYVYSKGGNYTESPQVGLNDSIYLCAFDETNKFNGFFKIKLGSTKSPVKLSMEPALYYFPERPIGSLIHADFILKAKHADVYLLKRMNTRDYPNLQITNDFRTFTPLTELEPENKFNWLTSELVKWKTFKGKEGHGILYKPENFDPHKKYPIIFHFYERLSAGLNIYIEPSLSVGPINIPYLVSQGYLVFCPDIRYTVGDPGESAYDYIVSAAKMLSAKSWVDAKHMGIQGHSWGGYEVNYLVTRTNLFASAASAAGDVDFISEYGSVKNDYYDSHQFVEKGQVRMGVTLWEDPSRYIRNSPIFRADKVSTPLLIMHNKNDNTVPWSSGVEFYTGLRRLNKKVWMLQYDNGGHTIRDDYEGQLDYTTRLLQFFDHYLKDTPAPRWMMRELPSNDTGYALDPSITCSKDCKVCKMWNEKMKKDPASTTKEILEKAKAEHWIGANEEVKATSENGYFTSSK